MSKSDDNNMPTTFPKKYQKTLEKMMDFKELADSSSVEDLKKIIVLSEGNISNIEAAMAEDVQLNMAKELVKQHSEPHREAIKFQTCRVKYALFCLQGKGHEIGDPE
jgi:hypothetical protein